MFPKYSETPLHAAFFCACLSALLYACTNSESPADAAAGQCAAAVTPIAAVQGDGYGSPLQGRQVTVRGIVTLLENGRGFYLEEPAADADPRTSDAVFVHHAQLPAGIETGAEVSVSGTVAETGEDRDTLTTLTATGVPVVCSSGHSLPLTDVSLPLDGRGRESLEGMRIRLNAPLTVTDVYQFDQGRFTLGSDGVQYAPTEVMAPGPATAGLIARSRASTLPVFAPAAMDMPDLVVEGMTFDQATGVFAHDARGKRLTLQSLATSAQAAIPAAVPATPGTLRVVGMNLHNYFNGDGKGSGFPTPRGAETLDEFQRQRARIGAAIGVLDPHVIAVTELENDGFGADSAARDFIRLAGDATQQDWAVTRPVNDETGSDKITVGIFYRTDQLQAIGPAETLTGPEFGRSRQPQAQLFKLLPDGESLLVVINHFKSKGSCPDSGEDADQNDGQGCWNAMRRASAEKMAAWARDLGTAKGTENILILGDMNAHRNEDPIRAIRAAGFAELIETGRQPEYSFVFAGQRGTLDYAFATKALREKTPQAFIWHVNASFPTGLELPQPWLGFSDHDPVVVALRLRQSSASD